jgi:hypothetical protein
MTHALRCRGTSHERTPQSRKRHSDKRVTLGPVNVTRKNFGFLRMCNQPPATNHEFSDPSERQGMTTDDLRRAAEGCRDLDDSALMAQAWDEPAPALESEVVRTFGQLPNIHVSGDFDEPLPDAEIAVWEADSAD